MFDIDNTRITFEVQEGFITHWQNLVPENEFTILLILI